jgi:hypothetical protein
MTLVLLTIGPVTWAQTRNTGRCLPLSPGGDSRSNASGSGLIALHATLPAEMTLSISKVDLNIPVRNPGEPSAIIAVPITSSWLLDSSTTTVELVAYFDSSQRALAEDSGHVIPSDHVLGGLDDQALKPFVESSRDAIPAASRTLFRQRISQYNARASRADILRLQLMSLTDLGAPQGNYQGTINLRLVSY